MRTRPAWFLVLLFQTQGLVLLPFSYLVMPYMRTDLQKIMGHEFSDEKIQYLVYQMLKGLKVGGAGQTARLDSVTPLQLILFCHLWADHSNNPCLGKIWFCFFLMAHP